MVYIKIQFYSLIPLPTHDITTNISEHKHKKAYFAKELSKNDIFVIEDPFLILRKQTNKSELARVH